MNEAGDRPRSRLSLTHRSVEALKPQNAAFLVSDIQCPGLAIRVAPSGQKTWGVAFRIRRAGTVRRVALGRFPGVSLELARDRAKALIGAAQAGRDLLAEERAAKAAADARVRVGELIEKYLKREVLGKLRTAAEIQLRLRRCLAELKDRFADEVKRSDLRAILDLAVDRGVLREAEKQRQLMRSLFHWALGQDIVQIDPTAGLASYGPSPRRNRILSPDEIRVLWRWVETCGMPIDYANALQLQLATGARIGEASGLHASEIDRTASTWTLPASRSKNGRQRVTPLVGLAREIVERRIATRPHCSLFVTELGNTLTSNCVASLLVKRRESTPLEHFTSHDLRRTVATGLVDLGFPLEVVAAVLGHEEGSKNVRTLVRHYVRTDLLDQKKLALAAWDRRLQQIISNEVTPSNVTSLLDHSESAASAELDLKTA